jgi:hypothetical protein
VYVCELAEKVIQRSGDNHKQAFFQVAISFLWEEGELSQADNKFSNTTLTRALAQASGCGEDVDEQENVSTCAVPEVDARTHRRQSLLRQFTVVGHNREVSVDSHGRNHHERPVAHHTDKECRQGSCGGGGDCLGSGWHVKTNGYGASHSENVHARPKPQLSQKTCEPFCKLTEKSYPKSRQNPSQNMPKNGTAAEVQRTTVSGARPSASSVPKSAGFTARINDDVAKLANPASTSVHLRLEQHTRR